MLPITLQKILQGRIWTCDPITPNHVCYQLHHLQIWMGRCGFEPQTFRIWAGCSNQLSYLPKYDVSYESRTHTPFGNCFWGSRVYQFRQRNIIWFRRESNSHTIRHQNLNLTCLPVAPLNHIKYLRKDSNLHTIWQLILSQPCLPLHHAGI